MFSRNRYSCSGESGRRLVDQRTDRDAAALFGCVSEAFSGNPAFCTRTARDTGGAAHKNLVICLTRQVSTCNSGFAVEFRVDLRCLDECPAVIIL